MRTLLTPLFLVPFLLCCSLSAEEGTSRQVLVSVAPYKYFVERISQGAVTVDLFVPAAADPHTYEPTPKEVLRKAKADLWFQIGEAFEQRAAPALRNASPNLAFISLCEGVSLICDPQSRCSCSAHAYDVHFWLSPKVVKIQAKTIAQALTKTYPKQSAQFAEGLRSLLNDLDQLDRDIQQTLQPLKNRLIFVSHPAYAYLARDYQLEQLSIEQEGKDPTPQALTKVLRQAKEAHVDTLFVQPQHSVKGATVIAQQLGIKIVTLDPFAENYLNNMRQIATQFANK